MRLNVVVPSDCTRDTCFMRDTWVFTETGSVIGCCFGGEALLLGGARKGEAARSKGDAGMIACSIGGERGECGEEGGRGADAALGVVGLPEMTNEGERAWRCGETSGPDGQEGCCQCHTSCL